MAELFVNNGNLLWMTRGKEWGFRFLSKCSSLPSGIDTVYKAVFLNDEGRFGYWKGFIFGYGVRKPYVACRCYDIAIQRDQAGRRIPHEFLLLCPDQEYNLLSRLTWESLILEQVRGLYSDRYSRCAAEVTDCRINFCIRPDSKIEHCDLCVALDVDLNQTIATSDQGMLGTGTKRHFAKLFFFSFLIICLAIGYTMCLKGISGPENKGRYILVRGMSGNNASMGCTPVTEEEWAKFTGKNATPDRLHLPVSNVSVEDAERYCAWLTQNDSAYIYRLPSKDEWDLAVGYMLKESKFYPCVGCYTGQIDGCKITNGKSNGITFWDNYWELTSTKLEEGMIVVKSVNFSSRRAEHRAEICSGERRIIECCTNATFRVVREDRF